MKSFKSIREGNSVEPGVSEIDDVPEDPMSFVEIKPKKTKIVKEGIVDTAANARVRIFSSIDRKKKELYKNAVKEELQEAVSVKKEKHSWGTMMTVHHGSDTSYPLHPEHQQAIAKLGDGEKTSFKDETNSSVHAHRDGDTVHLTRPRTSSTKTSVAHSHFNTPSEHAKPVAKKPAGEYDRKVTAHLKKKYNEDFVAQKTLSELKKSTLGSYIKKASDSATMSAYGAGGESQRHAGEPVSKRPDTYGADRKVALKRLKGIGKATDRLTKEEAELEEGIKSKIAGIALSALAAHGAAHGRVTPDGQGGFTGGLKPSPTVTAPASAPAAEAPKGFSREYLQGVVDGKHPRPLLSKEKAAEHLKNMKEETVVETKGAPKGFHFTKDGKLKRGDADQDGNGGPMLRTDPLDKQRNKVPAVSERVEQMDEKVTFKDVKMAVGVAKDKRYAGGNMTGAVKTMEKIKPGLSKHPRAQQALKAANEGVDFLKVWESIKPVYEAIKTTHEDPLVVTKDTEGHIHTHANLSVANAIHGTNVKHQAIHTGKPVQGGKFTFELSKHHEGALKEDAPFDPAAHKKELDQLMGKHMAAHTETTKLINAKAPQDAINKAQERNNAVKQEIRNHKDKAPKGPAPKPGSPGDYYASKKPGEYTGD